MRACNRIERIGRDTWGMETRYRPSSRQRHEALERLRSITAGVAVAGIAATAGFGFVAANGYRGTSSQGVTTAGLGTDTQGLNSVPGTNQVPFTPQDPNSGVQAPSTNSGAQPVQPVNPFNPFAGIQQPTRSQGQSHVSSGGS
jgi:hypothetical protein